jgi:hypothetical protein
MTFDAVVRLFHEALDRWNDKHDDWIGHGPDDDYRDGWVDDRSRRITRALLAAGWTPPREQ